MARSGTSGGGGCSQRAKCERPDGVALQRCQSITGLARSTIERGLKDLDAAPLHQEARSAVKVAVRDH